MKKNALLFNLASIFLCGLAMPAAADFCSPNYDCCEWSMLDGKMTVGADWLYWNIKQDGINPGAVVVSSDLDVTPSTTFSHKLRPNFNYENGFRVNLGYELPCDCWDMDVAYTYMPAHAKTKRFQAASDLELFVPTGSSASTPVRSYNAVSTDASWTTFASKWNLSFNNIDFDIGRTACFGECLKVRPHVGFRATWFDQKYRSFGTFASTGSTEVSVIKEKFQGYGVEGGLWADWNLGYGLSLVGHVGGSILYSKFKVHSDVVSAILTDDVLTVSSLQFTKSSFYSGTPTFDYFVGFQYADNLCDMLFKAYVGWEQHVMFDTNRFLSTGNLSGQGLTLGLDVGF